MIPGTAPRARWVTRALALFLCGLQLITAAGVGLALPARAATSVHGEKTPHVKPSAKPVKQHTALEAYSVGGTVFDDYNLNSVQDSRDVGVNGVMVTAYDAANSAVANTSSATIGGVPGRYSLSIPGGTGPVRIEFTNYGPGSSDPILAGFQSSRVQGDSGSTRNGSSVNFVDGTQSENTVNLGIERPSEYCQNNPQVLTSCYILGDQTNTDLPVLVQFPYNNSGDTPHPDVVAMANQLGTTWGLSYRRGSDSLFVASFMKRHAGFKPGGSPGSIYLVNGLAAGSPVVNTTPFVTIDAGTDPRVGDPYDYLTDAAGYDQVGKMSLGGMALSEDATTLYAMNLYDKKLYAVPIGDPSAPPSPGAISSALVPRPDTCAENDWRPFAVGSYRGTIYAGAVCSAESTITESSPRGDATKLMAYVYAYTPGSGFNAAPVFQMPLHYTRGCAGAWVSDCRNVASANWLPWNPSFNPIDYGGCCSSYPQPILSSIAFDNGDMILGLRDRFGDQMGINAPSPSGAGSYQGVAEGDTLRACLNTAGEFSSGWTLESNASCGGAQTGGSDNGEGPGTGSFDTAPGNGEYYYQDNYDGGHADVNEGGLLQVPGFTGVMTTTMDPFVITSGGTHTFDNANGQRVNGYQIYVTPSGSNTTFGKANGVGTLVAVCDRAPVEIGNRVWLDKNGNGIQDAGEPGIQGVTVNLYNATGDTLLQTATTDGNGEYAFTVPPSSNYLIKLDAPINYMSAGVLEGYTLSAANQGADTLISSKAVLPNSGSPIGPINSPQITVTAPQPGINTHTYDVGFVPSPDLSLTKTHTGTNLKVGDSTTYTISVSNGATAGPVLAGPITVTDTIPAGLSNIVPSGTNWSFSTALPSVKHAAKMRGQKAQAPPSAQRTRQTPQKKPSKVKPHSPPSAPSNSPVIITATYTGSLPIAAGATLPPITVTGNFTSLAAPSLINQAVVTVPGDSNVSNNTASDTVNVALPPLVLQITHNGTGCVPFGGTASFDLTLVGSVTENLYSGVFVELTDTLPAGFTNPTFSGAGWVGSFSGNTFTGYYQNWEEISQGVPPIRISGTVGSGAGTSLTNTATVGLHNITTSIASGSDTIPVCTPPDFAIRKTHVEASSYQVGQAVSYSLIASNVATAGDAASGPITVTDTIPAGLSDVQAQGVDWDVTQTADTITAVYKGNYPVTHGTDLYPVVVTGTLNSLAVGSLTNTATVTIPYDSNPTNDTATDTLTVHAGPDLSISKTHLGDGPFQPGQSFSYILRVSDEETGGSVLVGHSITVLDQLPVVLDNPQFSGTGWTFDLAPSGLLTATYNPTATIPAGTTLPSIVISGVLNNLDLGTLVNTAVVNTADDTNSSNNSSTDIATIVSLPDLQVRLTHQATPCISSGTVTYNLTAFTDPDIGPLLNGQTVSVSATLPTGLTNITVPAVNGWNITTSGNTVTATYSGSYPINAGNDLPTIAITGTLTNPQSATLDATASVTASSETNNANNGATDTIAICAPDLAISKHHLGGDGPFQVGQAFSYVISVSNKENAGPVLDGHPITVSDLIPSGLTNAQAAGTNWTINNIGTSFTATYNGPFPVAAGTSLPDIILSGQLSSAASPTLSNTASVVTDGDLTPEDNTATDNVDVAPLPDLVLAITHEGTACNQDGSLSYTLTVGNRPEAGPVFNNQPITVTFTAPNTLSNVNASGAGWTATHSGDDWTLTYTGGYPVAGGTTLGAITVTGNATSGPVNLTATVNTTSESNNENNSETDSVTVCAPDVTITETHEGTGPFQVGGSATFVLTASTTPNSGPIPVGGTVTITDPIPAGLSDVTTSTVTGTGWTVTINNGTITAVYTAPTQLQAGTSLPPLSVTGTLNNSAPPVVTNPVTVTTPGDSDSGNNGATDSIPLAALPDLSVVLAHPTVDCIAGGTVTYTLIVHNNASAGSVLNGQAITASATLPDSLSDITATAAGGWQISKTGNVVDATYTGPYPIDPDATLPVITITGTLSAPTAASLNASASVTLANDASTTDNTTTDTFAICGPDLTIVKQHQGTGPFQVGQAFSYTLSVSNGENAGPVLDLLTNPQTVTVPTVHAITVSDTLPPGLTNVQAVGTRWTTSITAGVLTATYNGPFPVAAGATLPNIVLSGQLTSVASPTLSNTATVTTIGDTNPGNNSSTDTADVAPLSDLVLAITHEGTACNQNGSLSYTFTVSNKPEAGPVPTNQPITVTFTAPNTLSNVNVSGTDWTATHTGNDWTLTYTGSYPVAGGATLGAITLTGNATSGPVNLTAAVHTANESDATNNEASDSVTICAPDVTISETHEGTGPFQVEGNATFVLTASTTPNSGPIPVGGTVTITDPIPAGLSGVTTSTVTGTGWTVTINNGTITAVYTATSPIQAGTSLPPLSVTGTLNSSAPPVVTNPVTVTTPGDSDSENNSATDSIPLAALPDLSVVLAHPTVDCIAGGTVTYTLIVHNNASAGSVLNGQAITASATLPDGLSAVAATAESGWQISTTGNVVSATYTGPYPIDPDATLPVITITGTLSAPTTASLNASASVTLANDASTTDNTTTDTFAICGPDLAIVKQHQGTGPFQVGQAFSYTLSVSNGENAGPVLDLLTNPQIVTVPTAHAITVSDTLPPGLTNVQAVGTRWTTSITAGVLTANYNGPFPVAAGATLPNIVLSGQLTSVASPTLSNTATVTTIGDTNTENNSSTDTADVAPLSDLVLAITHEGTACNQNGSLSYTFTVSNKPEAGPVPTNQPITVTFTAPNTLSNVNVSGTDWTATHTGNDWTLTYTGSYPVAGGATLGAVTLTGNATSGPVNLTAAVHTANESDATNNEASDSVTICAPDVTITETHEGAGPFQVGGNATFVLTASTTPGSGPIPVGGTVTITDPIPAGLTNVTTSTVTGTGWTVTINNGTITAVYTATSPIQAGTSLPVLNVTGTLSGTAPFTVTNPVTVTTPGDSDSENNSATDSIAVTALSSLQISLTHQNEGCVVGGTVTYTLRVLNPVTADPILTGQSINVSATLPTALSGINAVAESGWTITPTGNTINASYSGPYPLAPGAELPTITITGTLNNPQSTTLNATTSVTISNGSTTESNNASDTLTICSPDLTIVKQHEGTGPFQVGQAFSYTLSVSNGDAGPALAEHAITVTDTLPAGLTNAQATGTNWTTSITAGVLTATYTGTFPVAAGATLPDIVLSGQLTSAASPTLSNTAVVTTEGDINTENNSSTDTTTVAPLPDLTMAVTHEGTTCNQDGSVSFTVTVSNSAEAGPVLANQPITVYLTAPDNLSNFNASGPDWTATHTGSAWTLTYTGAYPVASGATLGAITVTGTGTSSPVVLSGHVETTSESETGNNGAGDGVIICTPDVTISETHEGTGPFQVGGNATFVLTASTTPGSGPIQTGNTVTITDPIPAGLSGVTTSTVTGTGWTVTIANGTITAVYTATSPIQAGTSLPTLSVTGQLNTSAPPEVANPVTVTTPGDSNSENNSATDSIPLAALPNLAVTLIHQDVNCITGGTVTYTLIVHNNANAGPVLTGQAITAGVTLPDGLSGVAATAASGWQISTAGNVITANYTGAYPIAADALLPPITITGTLSAPTTASLNASASVTLANDASTTDNTTTDTFAICGPDLAIVKQHEGTGPFQVGQAFSYTLSVSNSENAGPVLDLLTNPHVPTAHAITVSDTLPPGLTNVQAVGTRWTTSITAGVLTATYNGPFPVAAGATLPNIVLSGQLTSVASPTLSNTATVTTIGDTNTENNSSTDTVNVAPLPDLALAITHTGTACNQNGLLSYTLTVNNSAEAGPVLGNQPITVTLTAPTNLNNFNVTGTDWTATHSGTAWTLTYTGSYPVAGGATLGTITVTGNATSSPVNLAATVHTANDSDTENNGASDSVTICAPDVTIIETHEGTGPFQVGGNATFVLTASTTPGSGPIQAGGTITITDPIPAGMTNVTAAGTGWTVTIANGTITAVYTATTQLQAGTSLPVLNVTGTLTNAAPPVVTNPATVTTPGDSNPENNNTTDSIPVTTLPNLSVNLQHQDVNCIAGGIVTYTLTVHNNVNAGPVLDGQPVSVSATIPANLSDITAVTDSGWQISRNGSTISATYTGLYPITADTTLPAIIIKGTLNAPTTASLSATASVTLANDVDSTDNTTSDTFAICAPDLGITKQHEGDGPFQVGQNFSYVLSVSNADNAGPVLADHSITVNDTLPAGLTNVQASGTDWTISTSEGTLTALYTGSLPMAKGATLPNIVISGLLSSAAFPTLSNTATVSTQGDSNPENNSATDSTPVLAAPDLSLALTPEDEGCNASGTLSYLLTVSTSATAGPVLNGPLTVNLTEPANLSNVSITAPDNWQIAHTGTTWTLTYDGGYLVAPGSSLVPLTITGTASGSSVDLSATVQLANDSNTANNSATASVTICGPDLAINKTHQGAGPFQVGQSASFVLTVSNAANAGPVQTGDAIIVTDTIPAGLSNPQASGTNWNIVIAAGTLTATYTGSYPVTHGTTLPAILLSGLLTSAASPELSNTATVSTPHDSNIANNSATDTFPVSLQPDLTLTLTHEGSGCNDKRAVNYTLMVSNAANAGSLLSGPLTVTLSTPTGLSDMNVVADDSWQVQREGPDWMLTYLAGYPVDAAVALSAVTITGNATTDTVALSATVHAGTDSNAENDTATDTINLCTPDLVLTKTHEGQDPFQVGQSVSYVINVSNAANAGPILEGQPITVTDTIPAGLANVTASSNGWNIELTNGTLKATYTGDYPVESNTALPQILLAGQLTAAAAPNLSNTATVSTPRDTNQANDTDTDTIKVSLLPDLSVSLDLPDSCIKQGDSVEIKLRVRNEANGGPVLNGPIKATLTLPEGISDITVPDVSGWNVSVDGSVISATYTGELPDGDTLLPAIIVHGKASAFTAGGSVDAVVSPNSQESDSNPDNNHEVKQLKPCGPDLPDLSIKKTHIEAGPFHVGQTLSYTLDVSNGAGSGAVQEGEPIIVTDTLPEGFNNVQASGADWDIVIADGALTATYTGSYPVEGGAQLTSIIVSGQLTKAAVPSLTNNAQVKTPRDNNPENDSASDTVDVQAAPDLRLSIDNPNVCVRYRSRVNFDFHVSSDKNAGDITSDNPITLTFRIPVGLSDVKFSGDNWKVKKDGSDITATYVDAYPVVPGEELSTFRLSARVIKAAGGKVGFSAQVHINDDSHDSNNTDYGKLTVCKRGGSGNEGEGQGGSNPGGGGNNGGGHGGNNGGGHGGHTGGSTGGTNGGGHHGGTNGGNGFPGLPPTGSDPRKA